MKIVSLTQKNTQHFSAKCGFVFIYLFVFFVGIITTWTPWKPTVSQVIRHGLCMHLWIIVMYCSGKKMPVQHCFANIPWSNMYESYELSSQKTRLHLRICKEHLFESQFPLQTINPDQSLLETKTSTECSLHTVKMYHPQAVVWC